VISEEWQAQIGIIGSLEDGEKFLENILSIAKEINSETKEINKTIDSIEDIKLE